MVTLQATAAAWLAVFTVDVKMADRGRKAFPVSSHLVDEACQERKWKQHRERLRSTKARIDNTTPKEQKHLKFNAKKAAQEAEKAYETSMENQRLLRKLMNIADSKNVDHIKPWGARSSLSYKQGFNYDPISSQTYIDNIQFQRSPSAPPGQQSKYQKEMRELDIARENMKLLRAIKSQKAVYSSAQLDKEAREADEHSNRISNFRKSKALQRRCQTAPANANGRGSPLPPLNLPKRWTSLDSNMQYKDLTALWSL